MKRKLLVIAAVLLVAGGLLAICYPLVGNYLYRRGQQEQLEYYNSLSKTLAPQERNEAIAACESYNKGLLTGGVQLADPFQKDQTVDETQYESLLNTAGDGSMGYLEIPAIDSYLVIYHGSEEQVLQKGVGHLQGTSLPVGGKGTHAVLSGHTGMGGRVLFTDLDQLREGNIFRIHVAGEVLTYEVDQILTVLPEDMGALAIDPEEDYVTLVTCTPYGVNSHRLLVRGKRVPAEEAVEQEFPPTAPGSTWRTQYLIAVVIGVAVAAVVVLVVFLVWKLRRKKNV